MTKQQALYEFWSSFGWPAINEQSDVDDAIVEELGYNNHRIEYESRTGDYTASVALTASLFCRSSSWADVYAKAEEIRSAIGYGYKTPIDGGYLWITAQNPFTSDDAPADVGWRRVVLNITANFLTSI